MYLPSGYNTIMTTRADSKARINTVFATTMPWYGINASKVPHLHPRFQSGFPPVVVANGVSFVAGVWRSVADRVQCVANVV